MNKHLENKKLYKRLIADIPVDIHNRIKSQAAWKNITLRKWVLQAIMERLGHDEKFSQ